MGCCGGKRNQFHRTLPDRPGLEAAGRLSPSLAGVTYDVIHFEYLGSSALTVLGPITHKRYHFDAGGAKIAVDRRDAPSLLAVPHLKQVRGLIVGVPERA